MSTLIAKALAETLEVLGAQPNRLATPSPTASQLI
jgi:hypothetical protein